MAGHVHLDSDVFEFQAHSNPIDGLERAFPTLAFDSISTLSLHEMSMSPIGFHTLMNGGYHVDSGHMYKANSL